LLELKTGCPEFVQAGALWDTLRHTANGVLQFADNQLSTLWPVGFPFYRFNTIMETSFILISNGDLYRVPQF
jgi:hypothetical protein